jgi:hypothetical protein
MRQRNQMKELESIYVLRNLFRVSPVLLILACVWLLYTDYVYGEEAVDVKPASQQQASPQTKYFDQTELRELVGPIALYSDDLLALVLGAVAHPVQAISAARRVMQQSGNNTSIDYESDWHPSVVALTHYPQALLRFDQDLQWTERLHQAVAKQNKDVLTAIQAFRRSATESQALSSNEHLVVEDDGNFIRIRQRNPELIHVPDYQPRNVVEVSLAATHKIIHRTKYQPVVYRSYPRFDPYYDHRSVHDPFWYDPFWNDPLWGINGHGFLSRHDRHRHHPRTHRWWHKKHRRHHKSYNRHGSDAIPEGEHRSRHTKVIATGENTDHRSPRRHHSVNAFNQPMFENNRRTTLRTTRPPAQPGKPKRATERDRKKQPERRYTPDKKPIMHMPKLAAPTGPIK